MNNSVYYIISLLMCVACSKENDKKINHSQMYSNNASIKIHCDLDNIEIAKCSDLFYDTEYVKLETKKESLIGNISKVVSFDSLILIGDFYNARPLLLFNKSGKFISTIGQIGKGEGEYMQVSDFYLNKLKNTVLVLSSENSLIVEYELNGNYVGTYKFKFYAAKFSCINNHFVFYHNLISRNIRTSAECYNLSICDNNINYIYREFPYIQNINKFRYEYDYNFIKTDSFLFFSPVYDNSIYSITDSIISTYCLIDFGKYAIPLEHHQNKTNQEINNLYKQNNGAELCYFSFSNKNLLMEIAHNNRIIKAIYYPKRNEIKSFLHIRNDLHPDLQFSHFFQGASNELISYVEPEIALKICEIKKINSSIKNLKSGDNPILVFTKIK